MPYRTHEALPGVCKGCSLRFVRMPFPIQMPSWDTTRYHSKPRALDYEYSRTRCILALWSRRLRKIRDSTNDLRIKCWMQPASHQLLLHAGFFNSVCWTRQAIHPNSIDIPECPTSISCPRHAILNFEGETGKVTPIHVSLSDFLFDEGWLNKFYLNPQICHVDIMLYLLWLITHWEPKEPAHTFLPPTSLLHYSTSPIPMSTVNSLMMVKMFKCSPNDFIDLEIGRILLTPFPRIIQISLTPTSTLEKFVLSFGFKHLSDKSMRSLVEYIGHEWNTNFWTAFLSETCRRSSREKGNLLAIYHKMIQMFKVL